MAFSKVIFTINVISLIVSITAVIISNTSLRRARQANREANARLDQEVERLAKHNQDHKPH